MTSTHSDTRATARSGAVQHSFLRFLPILAGGLVSLLLAQFLLGMVVNLYVQIPANHPGSSGSSYFGRLLQSVPWAVAHGSPSLQAHAVVGLLLVVAALALVVLAALAQSRAWVIASLVGAFGVIGAGFNGGSFLNYGLPISSLLMSVGFAVALATYALALYSTR